MPISGDDRPTIYSDDDLCVGVRTLLKREDGDIDRVIKTITSNPCSYKTARLCADALAHCLEITPSEFIKRWRAMR